MAMLQRLIGRVDAEARGAEARGGPYAHLALGSMEARTIVAVTKALGRQASVTGIEHDDVGVKSTSCRSLGCG